MEVPLGMEWNTRKGFQRGILPGVTKKVSLILGGWEGFSQYGFTDGLWSVVVRVQIGTIIDPLEKLF
jgi:hypothetical protein